MSEQEFQTLVITELRGIRGDVGLLRHDVEGLKQDVEGLKHDVEGLKQDVEGLKHDVEGLKQDVDDLKQDVEGLKGEVDKVKNGMGAFGNELAILNVRVDTYQKASGQVVNLAFGLIVTAVITIIGVMWAG
jgi:uncharacterized protein YoxC